MDSCTGFGNGCSCESCEATEHDLEESALDAGSAVYEERHGQAILRYRKAGITVEEIK